MMDSVFAHVAALAVGSVFASVIYEGVAGNERFSLPFLNIILVTLVGTVLSFWWDWVATLATLGLYTAFCVAGGLLERFPSQVDAALGPPPEVPPAPVDFDNGGPSPEARRAHALETHEITDIVFRTEKPLLEIARALGIEDPEVGGESYWEWVIGSMGAFPDIDITRTHTRPAGEVDTRIFVVGGAVFDDRMKTAIVERLRPVVSGPIRCGQSIYLRGNDYDFVSLEQH